MFPSRKGAFDRGSFEFVCAPRDFFAYVESAMGDKKEQIDRYGAFVMVEFEIGKKISFCFAGNLIKNRLLPRRIGLWRCAGKKTAEK